MGGKILCGGADEFKDIVGIFCIAIFAHIIVIRSLSIETDDTGLRINGVYGKKIPIWLFLGIICSFFLSFYTKYWFLNTPAISCNFYL
jgi:hypothetical protein